VIRALIPAIVATAILAGCTTRGPGNFQCEADGELAEMHVGVASAWPVGRGEWKLTYTDGNRVRYFQSPGETCWLERAE
jgi:hypothetical protein